jgi:hypothetical protein
VFMQLRVHVTRRTAAALHQPCDHHRRHRFNIAIIVSSSSAKIANIDSLGQCVRQSSRRHCCRLP